MPSSLPVSSMAIPGMSLALGRPAQRSCSPSYQICVRIQTSVTWDLDTTRSVLRLSETFSCASSVLAWSRKSRPSSHGRAAVFTKLVFAPAAGTGKKASQCDGAMRCGPFTRSSNTTSLLPAQALSQSLKMIAGDGANSLALVAALKHS